MIATIIISIITCILLITSILFFPKVKLFNKNINTYWIVCLLGGIFILIFNCISIKECLNGLFSSSSLNPIKILILFFSMTFLSIFLDEVGFFKYLASMIITKVKNSQYSLFVVFYVLVSVLTIFTSNDIVILTFTPFICYFTKNAKINPIPYLVAEFAAANTWSMMLIIGNPTNIYLATSINIDFISYLKVMFVPTLISGIVQFLFLLLIFKRNLSKKLQLVENHSHIKGKLDLVFGLIHLIICLLFLVISSYLNISMWIICAICALSLIACIFTTHIIRHQKLKIILKTLIRLPYELIPFVLSMFIIVLALNKQGITTTISSLLGSENIVIKYGFMSYLSSNLINNIPMSVLFSTIPNFNNSIDNLKAIYSIIIGSNIGAFLTPIGALAGIMFTDLVNRANIKFGFSTFIKYGSILSLITLSTALVILELFI